MDFPAFRTSLKSELNARAALEIRNRTKGDTGLAALGMLLAPSLVEGAVDNFVTPQGIAAMVRSGETPEPERPVPADDTPAAAQDCWASAGVAKTDTRAKPRRAISAAAFITRGSCPSGNTTLP